MGRESRKSARRTRSALRGPGWGEEVKPYNSEKHDTAKPHSGKRAPKLRAVRTRKFHGKNKNLRRGQRLVAPSVNSVKDGSIITLCISFVLLTVLFGRIASERLSAYNRPSTPGEQTMNYRRFGRTGWNVSEIGYGMWGMAGWTGSEDRESLESLQRSVDLGCNFFDTAGAYGDGHSEQLLGKILRANKGNAIFGGPDKKLYAATKVPPKNRRWPSRREFSLDDCYPPEYIVEYVEKSLANMGVETLDLIQFHTWEDKWLDDERLPRAIEDLHSSGKVRAVAITLNRWEPWNGIRAVRDGLVDAV